MTSPLDPKTARRYLLGDMSEEASSAIEQDYVGRTGAIEAVDAIEAVEEALIEDYLDDRLAPADRDRFEGHYLPAHRIRVETIRRLRAAAGARAVTASGGRGYQTLALAAGLVIAVAGGVWVIEHQDSTPPIATQPIDRPGPAPAPAPRRLFAMTISPVSVRGASESPTLVIPAGTDAVDMRFEGEPGDKPLGRARVWIRTVNGDNVWQGPTAAAASLPAGLVGRVEVPAAQLRPDDYTVTVFAIAASGAESERYRYFLRVR